MSHANAWFNSLPISLSFNSAFSFLCGLLLLAIPSYWSAQFLAISPYWIVAGGIILIGFALQLAFMVKRQWLMPLLVNSVIISDVVYSVLAVGATVLFWQQLSWIGAMFLTITAIVVLDVATWQWFALKHSTKS